MNRPLPQPVLNEAQESAGQQPDIRRLTETAVQGLLPMLDRKRGLFCYRLVQKSHGLVREGLSPRYTAMTLLGLHEFEENGGQSPFDAAALYRSLASDPGWIRSAGDLGLFLWVAAVFAPDTIHTLNERFSFEGALDHYVDAREGRTMELAWFLTGLAAAAEKSARLANAFTDLALKTYRRLKENQGGHGFFGHLHTRGSLAGSLRGAIGSFADQLYPIYAISKLAQAFQVDGVLGSALECAEAICRAQGNLGQWWWLYDSRSGRVSSRYPVYSVHQHGMAPMGLFAIEQASGQSFQDSLYKGLRWIYGTNELGVDMRDRTHNLIWRCVLPKNRRIKYWETALSRLRAPRPDAPVGPLEVLYEDRPYELGWLLFAFSRKSSPRPA
jgi:hypothetical protein